LTGHNQRVESWRPIPGYEGSYEASDLGRIRSLPRRTTRGGILRGSTHQFGYRVVHLSHFGVKQREGVHVLVARTFLGPRPEGQEVRHRDGNPSNNQVSNLRYGTRSENASDAVEHGTHRNTRKRVGDCGHSLTDPSNLLKRPAGKRDCRECHNRRQRERYQRQALRAAAVPFS
jgi:hypothetical protein